jgi:hypothetical protein
MQIGMKHAFQPPDRIDLCLRLGGPDCSGITALIARLYLNLMPQLADPDAVLKRAMTSFPASEKPAIAFAAEHDCPVTAVFFYQIFNVDSCAHGSRLADYCLNIQEAILKRYCI